MSALALATLAMGWMQLRRRLGSAVEGEVAGVSVTVSDDVGPAVVGIVHPRIVVPRWLLQQDAETQGIVIAHEREHLRAQDIRVLGGALLVAVLLPWNLPVWWQLRRLRFAMEVDCDARVLRGGQSRSTYSAVLQPGAIARDATAPTFEIAPRQTQTMEARMLNTVDAQRRVIEHFDPAALSEGSRPETSCGSSSTPTARP